MNNSRLQITDTQEKILWTFLEYRDMKIVSDNLSEKDRNPTREDIEKELFSKEKKKSQVLDRFEPMIRGLTSYDLEKNGIRRRTWDINSKYLLDSQLVVQIREIAKGKQLRKYYDITPIGMYTLLQKLDVKTLEQVFLKKFSKHVPEIARHWINLKERFGDIIFFILKKSLLQINWSQHHKQMKIDEDGYKISFGVDLVEKTNISFESENMELALFRNYTDFTTGKAKQSRKEITDKRESVKIVIPTSLLLIDFDKISNNILKRLTFVFYYNLIRLHKEKTAVVELATWFWEQQKFEKWKKDSKKDLVTAFKKRNNEISDIGRDIMNASKDTVQLIKNDVELQKMLKNDLKEISLKFSKPKIIGELLSQINR